MQGSCPVCGSPQTRFTLSWKSSYSIHHCSSCKVLFSTPTPSEEELLHFYQGFLYRKPDPSKMRGLVEKKKSEIKKLFNLGQSSLEQARFLDHGGGTGATYQAAKELGFDVFFQEVDEKAIEFVKTAYGLPEDHVIRSIQDLRQSKFHFILSDNVVEHVGSPTAFVKTLYEQLEEGGTLAIKTPHACSADLFFFPTILTEYIRSALRHNSIPRALMAILRDRFWTCDPPRRLYAFSERSLIEIARQVTGEEGSYSTGYYHIPLFEYSLTKRFLTRPNSAAGILRRLFFLPLIVLEWVTKIVQILGRSCGLVAPGGIILFLRK
jgi:SAM-dependent methyltransferase